MSLGVPLEARHRSAVADAASEDPMLRFGQMVVVSWDEPNENERLERQRISAKIVLVLVANVLITTWIVNGDIQVRVSGGGRSPGCRTPTSGARAIPQPRTP